RIIVDGQPSWEQFRTVVGSALDRLRGGRERGAVRLYAEMVDLLWRDGRKEAATRLEGFWNQLGATHPIRLLCGYSTEGLRNQVDADELKKVYGAHAQVELAPEAELQLHKRLATELRRSQRQWIDLAETAIVPMHWVGPDGR